MDGKVKLTFEEKEEIVEKVRDWYKEGKNALDDWRTEAEEDYNFIAGNQWDDDDLEKLNRESRPCITFNRIGPMVATVLGIEANQRAEIRYIPREKSDTLLNDAMNAVGKWLRESSDVPDEEAAAFEDALTCGLGWVETRMEYDVDLDGRFVQERVDPFEMLWDPNAKKRGLVDRKWHIRRRKMEEDEIEEIWPDVELPADEPGEPQHKRRLVERKDDDYEIDDLLAGDDERPEVLHAQWYERETVYRTQDPTTGEVIKLTEKEYKKVKKGLEQLGTPVVKQLEKRFKYAFVYGEQLLETGDLPIQSGWSINALTGKYDRVNGQWYGIVRPMKDPQRWSNKFFSEILDVLHSNAKGGLLAEENAFVDARKAEEEWARSDSIIWLRTGAIAQQKITPKPVAQYPQGLDRLLQFAVQSIRDVSGINLELMGMANREQSGYVESIRKSSAFTVISTYFESLSRYRHQAGVLMHEFIKKFVPESTLQRVLAPEMVKMGAVQAIKQSDVKLFDIVVSESPFSEDNKAQVWNFLQTVLPVMLKMGMPFPPELLEYSPLPAELSQKFKMWMQPPAPPSPGIPPQGPVQAGAAPQPMPGPRPMPNMPMPARRAG